MYATEQLMDIYKGHGQLGRKVQVKQWQITNKP